MANSDDEKDTAPQGLSWGASQGEQAAESSAETGGEQSANREPANKDVMGVFGGDVPATAQHGETPGSSVAGRVSAPPRGSFLPRANTVDNLFAGENAEPEPALRTEHSTLAVLGSWATPEASHALTAPHPAPADVAGAFGANAKSADTKSAKAKSPGLASTMLGVSPPPAMSVAPGGAGLTAPTAMGGVPSKAPPGLLMDAPAALGSSAAPEPMGETLGGFGGLLPDMPDIALPTLGEDETSEQLPELAAPEPEPLALPEPGAAAMDFALGPDEVTPAPALELQSENLSPPSEREDEGLGGPVEPKRSSKLNMTLMGGGPEQEELAELRQQIEQEKRQREEESEGPEKSKKRRFGAGKGAKPAMPPEVPQAASAPSVSRSRQFFFVRAIVLGALAGLLGAGLWMEFSKGGESSTGPTAAPDVKPAVAPTKAVAAAPVRPSPAASAKAPPVPAKAPPASAKAPPASAKAPPAPAKAPPAPAKAPPAVVAEAKSAVPVEAAQVHTAPVKPGVQAEPAQQAKIEPLAEPAAPKALPEAKTGAAGASRRSTAGMSPAQIVKQAERLLREGEPVGAEAMLRPLAVKRPRDHHVMEPLAKALIAQGKGNDAVKFAKGAVKRRAKRASYRILLGDAHRAAGDAAAAARAYNEALKLDPGNEKAKRRLR